MKIQTLLSLLFLLLLSGIGLNAQSEKENADNLLQINIKQKVTNLIKNGNTFTKLDLVKTNNENELKKGVLLKIDRSKLDQINEEKNEQISLSIPYKNGKKFDLQLYKVDIFSKNFSIKTNDNSGLQNEDLGIHYRGVVNNEIESLAAISIFENEIVGSIFTNDDNYTVGKLDKTSDHILYKNDEEETLSCDTPDDGIVYSNSEISNSNTTNASNHCIEIAVEVDNDVYLNKGTGTVAFITSLFNQSAMIFANDGINVLLSEIYTWKTTSPYAGTTAAILLSQFQAQTRQFNGDLAQLVSFEGSGGRAAGFDGFCKSDRRMSKCFSNIHPTFNNYPIYSWNVAVFTHELGHLMGSRHTHACVWNGNGTAIDGCSGATEGGCALPGYPANGGTIMSYCHLRSVGINFNLGFGTQPRNVILNKINGSSCLNCEEERCSLIEYPDYLRKGNFTTHIQYPSYTTINVNGVNTFMDIQYGGSKDWHVMLKYPNLTFESGKTYLISYEAKAEYNTNINMEVSKQNAPYTKYYSEDLPLTTDWERKYFLFTPTTTLTNVRIAFNAGKQNADISLYNINIEDVDCTQICDQIQNGSFNNNQNWQGYINSSASGSHNFNNGHADVTINNGGNANWHVMTKQTGLQVVAGKKYTASFKAKADFNRTIYVEISDQGSPYTVYQYEPIYLDQNLRTYNFTFTANSTDLSARIAFNTGKSNIDVLIDDVVFAENDCQTQVDTRTPNDEGNIETVAPLETSIYPNPFNNYLAIQINKKLNNNAKMQLFDVTGKLVKEAIIEKDKQNFSFNTSDLNKGIYILEIQHGFNKTVKKVIKQ